MTHFAGQPAIEVADYASTPQLNSALYPRFSLAPASKLEALKALLGQLQPKLEGLPVEPVIPTSQRSNTELTNNASYMAQIYLQGQREITHLSIQVIFITGSENSATFVFGKVCDSFLLTSKLDHCAEL